MATFLRLKAEQLTDRMDAVYYRPSFVQNEDRLRNSSVGKTKLKSLVQNGRRAIYFSTSTMERNEAPESWVPFLTSDDLGDEGFFINLNSRRRVAPEFADKYLNGRLRANELLVKVKGPNQTTAYNKREPERLILVSGTIWGGLVRKDRVDPHYLVAVLSSSYAVTARSRLRTNTNVEFLAPDDLLNLNLPIPETRSSQTYIGDKVRQAERLRERARQTEAQLQQFFTIPAWTNGSVGHRRSYRTLAPRIIPQRLDAPFYNPAHLHLADILLQQSSVLMSAVARKVKKIWTRSTNEFWYLEIGSIALGHGSITPQKLLTKVAPSRAQQLVQPWDVLVSTVRPNRKNVALVPEIKSDLPMVASTGFSVMRFASKEAAVFYHGWLRSDAATQQLMQWNAGGAYPAIDDSVAFATLVVSQLDSDGRNGI